MHVRCCVGVAWVLLYAVCHVLVLPIQTIGECEVGS